MRAIRQLLSVCALAALSLAAMAEAPKNPWVRFNPQSWSKAVSTTEVEIGGQKSTVRAEAKSTLVSKTETTVVVETETTSLGKTLTVSREITLDAIPLGSRPVKPPKYGNETIAAAGRSFRCVTVESRFVTNDVTSDVKEWLSDEVPGGVVRSETTSVNGPARTRTVVELVDFQAM